MSSYRISEQDAIALIGIAVRLKLELNENSKDVALPKQVMPSTESGFKLGAQSIANRNRLHPQMARVVNRAIEITTQDFIIFETLRTLDQQKAMVRKGTSRTMHSKHLKQPDGFAHAMDLVPWIGGKAVWDWEGCYRIACAVDAAATEIGVADRIRWGGAWDRTLADFGNDPESYRAEVQAYMARHPGPDFIDGPHYEWVS